MPFPIRNSRIKLSQGQVFWREVGHGSTAIVFLNGTWNDGSMWLPVCEQLAGTYHCFSLDLLGFGDSDRPKVPYSISLEVETLLEFVDALRLKTFLLVAPEVGGWVAASFALKHPERVSGLVLLGAEGIPQPSDSQRWFWPRLLTAPLPLVPWVMRSLLPLARLLGKADGFEALLRLRQQLRRSPAACRLLFKRRAAEIKGEQLTDQIQWIKMPVLVLQRENDSPLNAALNSAYATAPLASLRLISDTPQDSPYGSPQAIAQEISTFAAAHRTLNRQAF